MAKTKTQYVCQNCGHVSPRWLGKCPNCESWNSLVEEVLSTGASGQPGRYPKRRTSKPQLIKEISSVQESRLNTQITEFDRVLGGGMTIGSLTLIGGSPGIGKSTLALQAGCELSSRQVKVLYVSGEESAHQLKLRSQRLKLASQEVYVLAETSLEAIASQIDHLQPQVVIIDSIQAIYTERVESAPGSVSQVRECASFLMTLAKTANITIFIIGHVTKSGAIAGPMVLEHIVDTVLYFEGERHHTYRILRAVKNRFGSTNEIGIFQMQADGLQEVTNPSEIFLSERSVQTPGSAVVCSLEGSRPLLVEIQALVSSSGYGVPQRVSTGIDSRRLAMLLAVLEKRLGLHISRDDVFINVAGGVKLDEPAVDLGTACAITSSFKNQVLAEGSVLIGEVGLGGEIRTVTHMDKRLKEAEKLGFQQAVIPQNNLKALEVTSYQIQLVGIHYVWEALDAVLK
ncbi:MAG: DNA repair protein RadA [Gemmatimonadetes bacterium]|nr:MAG: DNA repair protein RadA [Gemmatimonadota bacterium]